MRWASIAIFPLLLACGHPASERECQEIVERVAALELKKSTSLADAPTIADQVQATKKSLEATTLKDCVGKRITDRAMRCVRAAKTSQQIVDDCFR